ncbi:MAG: ribonuclease III domain-containing protein [Pseudomonadota bacterium]
MTDEASLGLEAALGHRFRDPALLQLALTHRTWVEEQYPGGKTTDHLSNQRLEFLGDAFLNYVVGRWLYERLPLAREGVLTGIRAALVEEKVLIRYTDRIGLSDRDLLLGRGERLTACTNVRLFADTFEALVGALLLDGGAEVAAEFVLSLLPDELPAPAASGDPISVLNEHCQKNHGGVLPTLSDSREGSSNMPTWTVTVEVDGLAAQGTGRNKQDARRCASRELLAMLGVPGWSSEGSDT